MYKNLSYCVTHRSKTLIVMFHLYSETGHLLQQLRKVLKQSARWFQHLVSLLSIALSAMFLSVLSGWLYGFIKHVLMP